MKVLICGDRNYSNKHKIELIINRLHEKYKDKLVIIEGECRGADILAKKIALTKKIKVEKYPANWNKFGKAAGIIRNEQMLKNGKPNIVIGFHSNIEKSTGTKHMLNISKKANIKTLLIN